MDIRQFIEDYKEAFGEKAALPIAFWHSDTPVAEPHGGLRHEGQAILMRTILHVQHSLLPHPYRRIKPSRNCKMRLHTAEMRHDDMFLD